ncbi:MAG: hypothetical protein OEZ13_04075 [Spirochaetia bacterium]|nr:hypothetical protein [Spirochaetia bacterium]
MSKRVIFYPIITDPENINDVIARGLWYFSYIQPSEIIFPISEELAEIDIKIPDDMDQAISDIEYIKVHGKIKKNIYTDPNKLQNDLSNFDIIAFWSSDEIPFLETLITKLKRNGKTIVKADKRNDRYEGSFYIQAGFDNYDDKDELIHMEKEKFTRLQSQLSEISEIFVYGTGPSFEMYKYFNHSNALSIICNTTILDLEFMNYVNPKILVFADPIFHFGVSRYAGKFREKLKSTMELFSDLSVIIPFKYYPMAKAYFDHADRIIGIPFEKKEKFNLNLKTEFQVKTTANILTLLQFPLASTFSSNINLIGFDGRPKEENKYFWQHNRKVQLNEEMDNIKFVHPGFFEINYDTYYDEHLENLDNMLNQASKSGIQVSLLTPSHMPVLSKYLDNEKILKSHLQTTNKKNIVISINPDLINDNGHYLYYDKRVSEEAEKNNFDFISLANSECKYSCIEEMKIIPFFKEHSWSLRKTDSITTEDEYREEFRKLFRSLAGTKDKKYYLYMYLGHIRLLPIIWQELLSAKCENISFLFNLFWSSFDYSDYIFKEKKFTEEEKEIYKFAGSVSNIKGIQLSAETERLSNFLKNQFHIENSIYPFFCVTDISNEQFSENDAKNIKINEKIRVVYPGRQTKEKGWEIVQALSHKIQDIKDIELSYRQIESNKLDKANNGLDTQEYHALFEMSDIILIPYGKIEFYDRTSGLFIDAVIHEKPIIATKDTLIGNTIVKYDIGQVFIGDNIDELLESIYKLRENYSMYLRNIRDYKIKWLRENNTKNFLNALLNVKDFKIPSNASSIASEISKLNKYKSQNNLKNFYLKAKNIIKKTF